MATEHTERKSMFDTQIPLPWLLGAIALFAVAWGSNSITVKDLSVSIDKLESKLDKRDTNFNDLMMKVAENANNIKIQDIRLTQDEKNIQEVQTQVQTMRVNK